MPTEKRRRTSFFSTSVKKRRTSLEQQHYPVKDIVEENSDSYLIDWETDKETGESFSPSWQLKEYVAEAAEKDWEAIKLSRKSPQQLQDRAVPPLNIFAESGDHQQTTLVPSRFNSHTESEVSAPAPHLARPAESSDHGSNLRVEAENKDSQVDTPRPSEVPETTVTVSPRDSRVTENTTPREVSITLTTQAQSFPHPESQSKLATPIADSHPNEGHPLDLISNSTSLEGDSLATRDQRSADPAQHEDRSSPSRDSKQVCITLSEGKQPEAGEVEKKHTTSPIGRGLTDALVASSGQPESPRQSSKQNKASDSSNCVVAHSPNLGSAILPQPTVYLDSGQVAHLTVSQDDKSSVDNTLPPRPALDHGPAAKKTQVMSQSLQTEADIVQGIVSRPSSAVAPQAELPLQDRVREIRGVAPMNVNATRANREIGSPIDSRSPSLAPEPATAQGVGDTRLEVQPIDVVRRDLTTQIQAERPLENDSQSSSRHSQGYPDIEELTDLGLGPMEFVVSLSMPTRVRDQYNSTVQFFNKHVKSFMSGSTEQATIDSMRRLINRLNNVSTHIDLEDDTTQSQREHEVPAEDEANWAISSSHKFLFLKHLFMHLQDREKHVAIVAKANRLLEILERFMIGCNFNYYREDNGHTYNEGEGSLKVTLVPSGAYPPTKHPRTVDLVIAFDSSFRADSPNVVSLRTNNRYYGSEVFLAPVVRPLVYCSAEHIQKCFNDGLKILDTDLDRLKATIACVSKTRSEVGVLQDTEAKPDAAAEEVAEFVLVGGQKVQWTLPSILPVKLSGIEIIAPPDNSRPRFGIQDGMNAPASPTTRKRMLEDVDMEDAPKRSRMSPGQDNSHSESIILSQESQISELNTRINELSQFLELAEIAGRSNEANKTRILELETMLAASNTEVQDQREAVNAVQTRYEDRSRAFHKLKHAHATLEENLSKAEARHETILASQLALKESKRAVETELSSARSALASSSIPEAAQLESAEARARTLATDNEQLKRRLESRTTEAEYARGEYQTASSRASELASRVADLEAQLAKQKRETDAARLREDNTRTETRLGAQALDRARLEAEELREQLRRRERGRGMTTRTGSVAPRSPRLGTSPVRSRAGSRAPGSRPNSPPRGLFGTSGRRPRGMVEQML